MPVVSFVPFQADEAETASPQIVQMRDERTLRRRARDPLNMYLPCPGTFTRKPGLAPLGLPLSISQLPTAAPSGCKSCSGLHAPGRSSSIPNGRAPKRPVNQAESATSSRLLALVASVEPSTANASASGRNTILSAPSQTSGETYSSGRHCRCPASSVLQAARNDLRSVSFCSGSRNGKRASLG